ncbi:Fe-S cluster assembly protein IscX [Neisseriaceae bacterium PsAf]|nr:Fe-S cluster assembly protein IscX [Neisseriaceae bacterium PsAf]MCV2503077.1 Fe-S cluster assembly protein IscX [Neisseriaceae bacterium]
MKWTDIYDIAAYLADNYPETDPKQIRFSQLRRLILEIPDFDDNPDHCGERILEAVQQAWIDELD